MLAVAPAIFQDQTFYISPNAGPAELAGERCSPFFFNVAWQNDNLHEAMGKHVADKGYKNVYLVAPNYPAGRDALNGFKRFYNDKLAQASFLVGCQRTREAAVVDANRHVEDYVEAAAAEGMRIAAVTETHIHADFVSGSRELAALGSTTIAGPGSNLAFPSRQVRDGEVMAVGDVTCTFLHTPGHTPEHISILVEQPGDVLGRLPLPWALLVAVVGGVDPDQLPAHLHDLVGGVVRRASNLVVHGAIVAPERPSPRCGEPRLVLLRFLRTRPGGGIGRRASLRC